MIVRLKVRFRRCTRRVIEEFQFYDSPIKSLTVRKSGLWIVMFQFYDSPIKSIAARAVIADTTRFQFYDSPIKSSGM